MSEENENTGLPEGWRESLPEEMRDNGILDTVKSLENLTKMAIDGRTLATNSLRIPSVDASAEDQKAFRDDLFTKLPDLMLKPDLESQDSINQVMKSLGMPEEASGYDMPEMPDNIQQSMTKLTETAHGAGLTKKQFGAITEGILGDYKENSDKAYGAMEEQRNELKTEWGAAYDGKVKTIGHFAKQTGFSDDFVTAITEGHIDATNMKAFDVVIKGYEGEANELGRQATNPDVKMTPQEADSQLNELMGNRDHAYWHPEDPDHESAKTKVLELGRLAETGVESETDRFRRALNGG